MDLVNFKLDKGTISALFVELGMTDFKVACSFVKELPYGRNSNKTDLTIVLKERKGTCSTKHALLATLAEENEIAEIELIAGIFLMDVVTHPILTDFFKDKPYNSLPELHCYLRYKGERFDFTSKIDRMPLISPKIVREQRIEPHQVGDWKKVIHQDYLQKWLFRKPELEITLEELWEQREECIQLLS